MCDVNTFQSMMCKLPFNSVVDSDGISAEHICFANFIVAHYLSLFFNMCILHGYIPISCINTVNVPILKNKNGNHKNCCNYRLIVIATEVSKLFEQVIFFNIENFLNTTNNQFGFKTKHITDMCFLTQSDRSKTMILPKTALIFPVPARHSQSIHSFQCSAWV